jgi:hypothetical protein
MGAGCLLALGTDPKQSDGKNLVCQVKAVISWLFFVAILVVFKTFSEEETFSHRGRRSSLSIDYNLKVVFSA